MQGGEVPSTERLRLIVADDHAGLLVEVQSMLASEFDIVATVRDGLELVKAAEQLRPEVVITDIRMPLMDGIDASREIVSRGFCRSVVLLTTFGQPELVRSAFNAGILGYVLKINAGEELIPAVRAAIEGRSYLSHGVRSYREDVAQSGK